MQKTDGRNYWWEDTLDGIFFTMTPVRSETLWHCYNRYYYRIEANKPFNADQLYRFVKSQHPYFWYQADSCIIPNQTRSIEISETVDSSD